MSNLFTTPGIGSVNFIYRALSINSAQYKGVVLMPAFTKHLHLGIHIRYS